MTEPLQVLGEPHWRRVACVSDVHLQAADTATADAWAATLQALHADALCVLGDLFDVWVGDDVLQADPALDAEVAAMQRGARELATLAQRLPVYVMHGNRDFLLGPDFAAATGVTLLDDPVLLRLGAARWLLSHGDAWCTNDTDYQRFRVEVRAPAWQRAFLAQPLAQRLTQARALRQRSRAHQQARAAAGAPPSDVNPAAVLQACRASGASGVLHGHTHRPATHTLPQGIPRLVLSDWDARVQPPRGDVLVLQADGGWQRLGIGGRGWDGPGTGAM